MKAHRIEAEEAGQRGRLIVLTTAGPGELPTEYLTDSDRFPDGGRNTPDLAKARHWKYPPGTRRFLKRNPHLKGYRRVWVPAASIAAAAASDAKAAAEAQPALFPPPPGRGAGRSTGRQSPSNRRTKTDPNKRSKRAARKKAVRVLRRKLGKVKPRRGGRKQHAPQTSR